MSEVTEDTVTVSANEDLDGSGMGAAGFAAIGSVGLALYYYYVRGEKQRGQFVGLWPATILGLAAYRKLGNIQELLEQRE